MIKLNHQIPAIFFVLQYVVFALENECYIRQCSLCGYIKDHPIVVFQIRAKFTSRHLSRKQTSSILSFQTNSGCTLNTAFPRKLFFSRARFQLKVECNSGRWSLIDSNRLVSSKPLRTSLLQKSKLPFKALVEILKQIWTTGMSIPYASLLNLKKNAQPALSFFRHYGP